MNANIKFKRILGFGIGVVAISALLLAGCGGSDSGGGGGITTSLTDALKATVPAGVTTSTTFKRRDGTAISNVNVSYKESTTNTPGIPLGSMNFTGTATDVNGTTSSALPSGAKTQTYGGGGLVSPTGTPNPVVGSNSPVSTPLTVGATLTSNTLQGEEYVWSVSTGTEAVTSVTVQVYQTDASGKADIGSYKTMINPFGGAGFITGDVKGSQVLKITKTFASQVLTNYAINFELMPGNYRVVTSAVATTASTYLASDVSAMITSTATGIKNQSVTLSAGKNISVTLLDTGGVALSGYTVFFYDPTTLLTLGTVLSNASGVATLGVSSSTTDIIAVIYGGGVWHAFYPMTLAATGVTSATLQQYTVTGNIVAGTGCTLPTTAPFGTVLASPNTGIIFFDSFTLPTATVSNTLGNYSLTLFANATTGVKYNLSASVPTCADSATNAITMTVARTGEVITVSAGGQISGKVSTKGGAAVPGVVIKLFKQTSASDYRQYGGTQITDVSGNYTTLVPYGTYQLWADGSVTEGISVSAGSTLATKNLVQYALTGFVQKMNSGALVAANAPAVYVGSQTTTANASGQYNVKVVEGKTWFCAIPNPSNEPTLTYMCNLNVQVDAASVTAAGQ